MCSNFGSIVLFLYRPRNVRGVRAMWNKGEPLSFTKRWNPFSNEVPLSTFTSHPLLWHKGAYRLLYFVIIGSTFTVVLYIAGINAGNTRFDIESFAERLTYALDQAAVNNGNPPCKVLSSNSSSNNILLNAFFIFQIDHQPIVLQNYVGIGSLIHNRNALGFFKIRGKFSF